MQLIGLYIYLNIRERGRPFYIDYFINAALLIFRENIQNDRAKVHPLNGSFQR
jgi:hypothetical protein